MKTNKTVYGLLAFGPLAIFLIGFIGFITTMMMRPGYRSNYSEEAELVIVVLFVVALLIGTVLGIISLIMYILHINKNPRVPEDQRIAWILGMVLVGNIASIVYFFMYIMKEEEIQPPAAQGTSKNPWQ
jgi:MFS family permease